MGLERDLAFIAEMERAIMLGDPVAAGRFLEPDIAYTVGASPTVTGVAAIIAYIQKQNALARWTGHTPRGAWRVDDTLIVEVLSHFTRVADGAAISFPCTDIYRFKGPRIADWRVFADMSPFHAGAPPRAG